MICAKHTVWALLKSYDWNCLVTACRAYCEPGPFDVRSPVPRPTAVAPVMRELAAGRTLSHPVLCGEGWWRPPGSFFCLPVATRTATTSIAIKRRKSVRESVQPLLIIGARGTLVGASARICTKPDLAFHALNRRELDITDPAPV